MICLLSKIPPGREPHEIELASCRRCKAAICRCQLNVWGICRCCPQTEVAALAAGVPRSEVVDSSGHVRPAAAIDDRKPVRVLGFRTLGRR